MKYQHIINKSLDELYDSLYNLKKELLSLRIQRSTDATSNTSQIRKARRDVARIKTRLVTLASNNQSGVR